MTPKKESLASRAARGDYDLVVPLDYKILEAIPAEGTMLAGLYEIGATAKELGKTFPALSSASIATRLRLLKEQGLTRQVKLVGGGHNSGNKAWQRTRLSESLLREWRRKENGDANG